MAIQLWTSDLPSPFPDLILKYLMYTVVGLLYSRLVRPGLRYLAALGKTTFWRPAHP